jgi:DNA-binding winged helix-turn-helix (wHTH) protein
MASKQLKIVALIFSFLSLFISETNAQDTQNDRHIEVSLRMIGHQVLLSLADSTSRVLPIIKEKDRYKLQFESEFEIIPQELVATVDRVVKETKLAKSYIVEVEECKTGEMVYSFQMAALEKSDIIPCAARILPKSCYNLLFTLLETGDENIALPTVADDASNQSKALTGWVYPIIIALFSAIALVCFYFWKRRKKSSLDENLIALGEYYFDKRNTVLLIKEQRIELTSKEADLLLLLYNSANTTIERELILNRVWGDEGDYVGRTLDVFISKLRKKLEFDSKVKIVNIRGIGYKLVLNV